MSKLIHNRCTCKRIIKLYRYILVCKRTNRPRSIYQYSNMAPRLSGQTSIFGVVFFVSKSLLGIERQKKLEKFAILTRKPRSHAWILIYRTWPIRTTFCLSQGVATGFLTRSSSGFLSMSLESRPIKANPSPKAWWILMQMAVWSFPGMSKGTTSTSHGEILSRIGEENCSLSILCNSCSLHGDGPSNRYTCLLIWKSGSSCQT